MKISISLQNDFTTRHAKIFFAGLIVGVFQWLLLSLFHTLFPNLAFALPETHAATPNNEIGRPDSRSLALSPQYTSPTLPAPSHAYALVSLTQNSILAGQNIHTAYPIASLTKLMTAMVAIDMLSAKDVIVVTEHAANQVPTKIGLRPQDRYRRDELLKAALILSANDAAQALADGVDGKYGNGTFIKKMNEYAERFGMKDTEFDNAMGFDGLHNKSSAYDLALLTREVLHYPLITSITSKQTDTFRLSNGKKVALKNWNSLLGTESGVTGLKTGITKGAKHTSIVTAKNDGNTLVVIVLGAPSSTTRDVLGHTLLGQSEHISRATDTLSGGRQFDAQLLQPLS